MTEADRLFSRFPPFVQDYIYSRGWQTLRPMQLHAARVILESDNNLLLSSSTASGKTEAAIFPILTELLENPPEGGVSVLYIAPLKSLLNDQFYRIEELLSDSGFPVFHWHGDVSASEKKRLLERPSGILQITPESLESMLLRRSNDLLRIFKGLRYIILDEIHTLIGSDRGGQLQCQMARLAQKLGRSPRRIGLSATVGDIEIAADWLGEGSGRETAAPKPPEEKLHWRLGLQHFFTDDPTENGAEGEEKGAKSAAEGGTGEPNGCLKRDAEGATEDNEAENEKGRPTSGAAEDTDGAEGYIDSEPSYLYGNIGNDKKLISETPKNGANHLKNSSEDERNAPRKHPENTPKSMKKPDGGNAHAIDAGFLFLYEAVQKKKALVFSNSREETEYVTATLRQIAKKKNEADLFYIHHGNLSAALREDAERTMKNEEKRYAVTCATVTMELGIDIGLLERVIQMGSPYSVSSFLQRIGRSGRRGAPPEMLMLFREDAILPNTPLPELLPWELLRGIALVELYVREHFIEPPRKKQCPFSLAFHQTLSLLAASGEMTPKHLAERIFSFPPLQRIEREDYRHLLLSMIENDFLEMTEEKGLIVGLEGERLLNSFKFYAVFRDSEDYTVREGSDEIGTITSPPPVGDRFALAGRVWEVTELDLPRHLLYVKGVEGKMEVSWPGDTGEVHTRILEKMREVLLGEEEYAYLMPAARERLMAARRVARNTGMHRHALLSLGGQSYVLFPWLGTRGFRAVRRLLTVNAASLGISDLRTSGAAYITFKAEKEARRLLAGRLSDIIGSEIELDSLVSPTEHPLFDKYDEFIPSRLTRRAYARDRLDLTEAKERLSSLIKTGGIQ